MKRLLFICACIFFLPVLSFAVDETCVVVAQEDPAGEEWAVYDGYIVLKCTAPDIARGVKKDLAMRNCTGYFCCSCYGLYQRKPSSSPVVGSGINTL